MNNTVVVLAWCVLLSPLDGKPATALSPGEAVRPVNALVVVSETCPCQSLSEGIPTAACLGLPCQPSEWGVVPRGDLWADYCREQAVAPRAPQSVMFMASSHAPPCRNECHSATPFVLRGFLSRLFGWSCDGCVCQRSGIPARRPRSTGFAPEMLDSSSADTAPGDPWLTMPDDEPPVPPDPADDSRASEVEPVSAPAAPQEAPSVTESTSAEPVPPNHSQTDDDPAPRPPIPRNELPAPPADELGAHHWSTPRTRVAARLSDYIKTR